MFENLLYQHTGKLLEHDLAKNSIPGALLLSGPEFSGKLTCALELARVLSCTDTIKGRWTCMCPACIRHKVLANPLMLVTGPRSCLLEINAAKETFITAEKQNQPYKNAAMYLFIRSIRKLTLRFSQILWEDDEKVAKIAALTESIDEKLELIKPGKPLPAIEVLEKNCSEIASLCEKLESSFMYDSIPVSQIKRIASWARMTTISGKKTVIIENADQMLDTSRNALLKILEEPPEDVVFILTTTRRGAVMPTILSRVRTYSFVERLPNEQAEIISRVYHNASGVQLENKAGNYVSTYLQNYLPISPEKIKLLAENFLSSVENNQIIDIESIVKTANGFEPRVILQLFLKDMLELQHVDLSHSPYSVSIERQAACAEAIRICLMNISTYNQSPLSALEQLAGKMHGIYVQFK